MKLAVIGGGYFEQTDHFHLNQRLIELTGKHSPNVLFIPTASNDDEDYIKDFRETFEKQLQCDVHILRCIKENPSEDTINEMIQFADLIYLGGGNYINMLEKWKEYKIDEKLLAALHNETFIAGYSSGAMCWFTTGLRSHYKGDGYLESDGWNIINKHFCPHYNQPDRATAFHLFLQNHANNTDGIALEDNCALYITEHSFEIIGDPEKAWEFYIYDGKLMKHHFDVTLKSYL